MEIKVEDLKNYTGVPVCYIKRRLGIKQPLEEWLVIESVMYFSEDVKVTFTDKDTLAVKRKAEHTCLFISV